MAPRRPLLARTLSAAGLAGLLVLSVAACTPTRSVAAYCSTVQQHKQRYLAAMNNASSAGSLTGLLEAGTAIGDLKSMWDDLAKVAPADIQTDSETVRDAWDKANDDAGDRNFFGAAVVALSSAAAMERVNDYISEHCGVNAAPVVASQRPTSSTPAPTTPATDSSVARVKVNPGSPTLYSYGPRGIIMGETPEAGSDSAQFSTSSVIDGQIVTASGTATTDGSAASLSDIVFGAQQLAGESPGYVIAATSHAPAQGLTPESWKSSLTRYDATSGTPSASAGIPGCNQYGCFLNTVALFGDVAVVGFEANHVDIVEAISLGTQQMVWQVKNAQTKLTSGDLVIVQDTRPTSSTYPVFALNAATGTRAWTFKDPSSQGAIDVTKALSPDYALIASPANTDGAAVNRYNVVDLQTGRVVVSRYASDPQLSAVFDPVTSHITLAGVATTADAVDTQTRLETLDIDGTDVFAISGDQYEALGKPSVLAALGGKVWIRGQSGVDEVDAITGAQDPDSPQLTGGSDHLALPTLINGSVAVVETDLAPAAWPTLLLSASGAPTLAQIAATTD